MSATVCFSIEGNSKRRALWCLVMSYPSQLVDAPLEAASRVKMLTDRPGFLQLSLWCLSVW